MKVWLNIGNESFGFELVGRIPEVGETFENERVMKRTLIKAKGTGSMKTMAGYDFHVLSQTIRGRYDPDDHETTSRFLCVKNHPFTRLLYAAQAGGDAVYYFDDDKKVCLSLCPERNDRKNALGVLKEIGEIREMTPRGGEWFRPDYDETCNETESGDGIRVIAEVECHAKVILWE